MTSTDCQWARNKHTAEADLLRWPHFGTKCTDVSLCLRQKLNFLTWAIKQDFNHIYKVSIDDRAERRFSFKMKLFCHGTANIIYSITHELPAV